MSHKLAPTNSADARKTKQELLAELQEIRAQLSVLKNDNSDLKALQGGEARLRAMIDASPVPMVAFAGNRIILVNRMFSDTFGYTIEDIPTLDCWWPLAYPDEEYRNFVVHRWDNAVEPAIRDRTYTTPREVVVRCKDGSRKNVVSYFSSIGDLNLSVLYDITGRKRAEEALISSRRSLEKSQEVAHVGSWELDVATGRIERSAESYRIFGLIPGEGMNDYKDFLSFIVPEDRERVDNIIRSSQRAGEPYAVTYCIRRVDGEYRIMFSRGESIKEPSGQIIRLFGTNQDVTEQKQAEREIIEARMQAELYLDLMGHDISNMHQIAMNQLELAQEVMDAEGELKAGERELIDTPLETLARSARLIHNVRNLQKVRRGEFKEEHIDLNDLLSNVVKEYRAIVPDNSIEYMPDGRRPVMANKLLHDVFSNLVGNAIKHSNGNGTKINILLESSSSNGNDYYKVSIEDNGPGVPDDMKNKIFNRLERGQTSAKGMGLGLYLVRSLVESYHGKVWVEDRVTGDHTKGARFVVLLPAVAKD